MVGVDNIYCGLGRGDRFAGVDVDGCDRTGDRSGEFKHVALEHRLIERGLG